MNDRDCYTVDAMEKFGGSFIKALGNLARQADAVNLEYIKVTWEDYWEKYENMGKKLEEEKGYHIN